MSEKLDIKKCSICGNEECLCENKEICNFCENTECTCENIEVCPVCKNEVCVCEEVCKSIRRRVQIDFEEYPESLYECDCDCDCNGECGDECICNKKKSLTVLGATIATVAVAGGILYLVKRKK